MKTLKECLDEALLNGLLGDFMEWDEKHGPTLEELEAFERFFGGSIEELWLRAIPEEDEEVTLQRMADHDAAAYNAKVEAFEQAYDDHIEEMACGPEPDYVLEDRPCRGSRHEDLSDGYYD